VIFLLFVVADLSDLSAQTDAFAKSHRPPSASPKEALSPTSVLMRSGATPPLLTPPAPSRSSSYSSVVSCASVGLAKSPDLVPSGPKCGSDNTMTSPSDVDVSPIGRHSPALNPIGELYGLVYVILSCVVVLSLYNTAPLVS